jgi:hypothetical protein
MITEDAARQVVYQHIVKAVSNRVENVIPELPKETLAQLSLAGLLNLLFLLRGDWATIGDYMTTSKVLRVLLGEKLLWSNPQEEPDVPAKGLLH